MPLTTSPHKLDSTAGRFPAQKPYRNWIDYAVSQTTVDEGGGC